MRKESRTAQVVLGLTLILGGTKAFAQDDKMIAEIPFSFNVGKAKMESGQYTVRAVGNALTVRAIDGTNLAVSITHAATPSRDLHNGRLVFSHYDGEYFLSEVFWPAGRSRVLAKSPAEIEAARKHGTSRKRDVAIQCPC
jgi:hypothetical protein